MAVRLGTKLNCFEKQARKQKRLLNKASGKQAKSLQPAELAKQREKRTAQVGLGSS